MIPRWQVPESSDVSTSLDSDALVILKALTCSGESFDLLTMELRKLPAKWLRWLARMHADNAARRQLLEWSGIQVGAGTVVNCGFTVSDDYRPLLRIGERVAIGPNVQAICVSNPNNSLLSEQTSQGRSLNRSGPIVIADDAWIGAGVVILPGVSIGRYAVIGANSVVSRDVGDLEVVAGAPLRHLRFLEPKRDSGRRSS